MASHWKKATEAKVNGGGVYFTPGKYRVKIKATKTKESDQGSDVFAIVETEVLESDNDAIKVGDCPAQVINLMWKGGMGYVNVKKFVAAALGVDVSEHARVDELNHEIEKAALRIFEQKMSVEDVCEYIFEQNPLGEAAWEMPLHVVEIESGPKGERKKLNRHDWKPAQV